MPQLCSLLSGLAAADGGFPHERWLSPTVRLRWHVEPQRGAVVVDVAARTGGWVGVGLSELGSMVGLDAWVAFKHGDGVSVMDCSAAPFPIMFPPPCPPPD
eukprot:gene34361-7735_t